MAHSNHEDKQEYQGTGRVASALGQSQVDGLKGGVVGAGLGAAAGAILHNKEAHELSQSKGTVIDKILDISTEAGERRASAKEAWRSFGRGEKSLVAGAVTALAVSGVGAVAGLVRGARKAGAARNQVNELTVDNKELNDKLAASEKNLSDVKSTVAIMNQPSEKSHVAELENRRAKHAAREAGVAS